MTEPPSVSQELAGRACCTYCRTEFDARRPRGCPICAVTGRSRRHIEAVTAMPVEEETP